MQIVLLLTMTYLAHLAGSFSLNWRTVQFIAETRRILLLVLMIASVASVLRGCPDNAVNVWPHSVCATRQNAKTVLEQLECFMLGDAKTVLKRTAQLSYLSVSAATLLKYFGTKSKAPFVDAGCNQLFYWYGFYKHS